MLILAHGYMEDRNHLTLMQHLRVWRMRVLQLKGPQMQAHLFLQRSQRLKIRFILRAWRERLKLKRVTLEDNFALSGTHEHPDRAHTAPITPTRSTRRLLWRNLNSR